jgi:hypothetical protein
VPERNLDIIGRWRGEQLTTGIRGVNTQLGQLHLRAKSFTSTTGLLQTTLGRTGLWAAAGFAIYSASKKVIDMDTAMVKLQNSGHLTATEMPAWREQIYHVAMANHMAAESISELSTAALKASHNTAFVNDEMDFMAKMANATGIPVSELGEYLGTVNRETRLTGKAFEEMMGKLASMSAMTGVETDFAKLLPSMPALIRTYVSENKGSMAGLGNFLSLAMFSPSPTQLNKNIQTMVRKMQPPLRQALHLTEKDVESFDLSKIVENIDKLAPNVSAKADLLQQVFGRGALNIQYMTDHWDDFKRAVATGNVNTMLELAKNKSESMASSFQTLATAAGHLGDVTLAPAIKALSDSLKSFDTDSLDTLAKSLAIVGDALGKIIKSILFLVKLSSAGMGMYGGLFAMLFGKMSSEDFKLAWNETGKGVRESGASLAKAWETAPESASAETAKKAETDKAAAATATTPKITNQHNIKVYINQKEHQPSGIDYNSQMYIGAG